MVSLLDLVRHRFFSTHPSGVWEEKNLLVASGSLLSVSGLCVSEKAMAPHSSTLAWKIPWTEGPGGLQSTGSLGVGHDWATSLSLFTFVHWRRKWQPTQVFLPGESQERGAWWAAVYGVAQNRIRLKRLSSSSSSSIYEASLVAQLVKNSPTMQETWERSLGWEDPLEKGKATHSSILAWRIPWTVYSMG